jgi:hypothetical protein
MPNELVPTQPAPGPPRQEILTPPSHSHGGEEIVRWDLPAEELYGPRSDGGSQPEHSEEAARRAEDDAAKARRMGQPGLAITRREDAKEHRQTRWDWGDLRTWMILIALTALGLLLALGSYSMPRGRDAAQAPIRVY